MVRDWKTQSYKERLEIGTFSAWKRENLGMEKGKGTDIYLSTYCVPGTLHISFHFILIPPYAGGIIFLGGMWFEGVRSLTYYRVNKEQK